MVTANQYHLQRSVPLGIPRCGDDGGKSRRTGLPCKNYPETGAKRCRLHGSRALKGPAHPNFTGGNRSRYAPRALREHSERVLNEPELLSVRHDLGVHKARIDSLREQTDALTERGTEAAKTWQRILETAAAYARDEDPLLLTALLAQISEGSKTVDIMAECRAVWQEEREEGLFVVKLIESELKLLERSKTSLTAEQAYALALSLENLLHSACDLITDQAERKAVRAFVHRGMDRLNGPPADRPAQRTIEANPSE